MAAGVEGVAAVGLATDGLTTVGLTFTTGAGAAAWAGLASGTAKERSKDTERLLASIDAFKT